METAAPGSVGLLGSLRGFADGLLGSAHDRIELLSVELQEEKCRLLQMLVWIGAIVLLTLLALMFVSFALVVLLWETARLAAVCSLAGLYVAGLIATIIAFRRYLRRQPKPFAGTMREFSEDRACIHEEN